MEKLRLAKQMADQELEHVSGGRDFTPREEANMDSTDRRAMEVVEQLKNAGNNDALRKFKDDYYEAACRYTKSVLADRIAPDSVMFSDFFETYYGWPY